MLIIKYKILFINIKKKKKKFTVNHFPLKKKR